MCTRTRPFRQILNKVARGARRSGWLSIFRVFGVRRESEGERGRERERKRGREREGEKEREREREKDRWPSHNLIASAGGL
jgi:hypothetical protein